MRGNFGDTAYFETVSTNSNGTAKVTFTLPDNVTTYTVTAHSANKDLYVGVNTKDIVSKLNFFIQSTEPRNVKVTDDLVLNATSIAEEVYDVDYEFTIKELNKTLTSKGKTNSITSVNFGKIPFGTYHAVIKGKHGDQEDGIEYEFNIVKSAQEVKDKKTVSINKDTTIKPSKNPIVLEMYNKNMEQYLKYIDFIESTLSSRLDTQIAYNKIQNIKDTYYNTQSAENYINLTEYEGNRYFKNLKNGKEDIILTALVSKYAKDYYTTSNIYDMEEEQISKDSNIFEIYLLAAANKEPVLTDLLYLKQEKNISNYNKLLVTLSLEFLGDYKNAKELYNTIELNDKEKENYESIIALAETYINKEKATIKINELIKKSPSDEYLRFAILSFFENNANDIAKQDTVQIVSGNINETITINGMQVKRYTLNNEDLSTIKFKTESQDLMVSYYYQTLLDEIKSKNISKDINIKINGKLKKGNTVKLIVNFNKNIEGEVKIALPNSLRLVQSEYNYDKYYLVKNRIDYVTFYKTKKSTKMEIPLIVTFDGKYKFENIVSQINGTYHISNSLNLDISK